MPLSRSFEIQFNYSYFITGATSGAGIAYTSGTSSVFIGFVLLHLYSTL